jgi:hypothetical protein
MIILIFFKIVSNELVRMWKEAVMAIFETGAIICVGRLMTTRDSVRIVHIQAET